MRNLSSHQDIAIVGMGCRLPGGVDSPQRFWDLLSEGVDAISEVPPDRFDIDDVYDPDPATPGKIYTRWGGFLDQVDGFDADFFGISPREARRMDPQHRLLLEVVWEALEDGGQVAAQLAGTSTGVFIGISTHDYADLHVRPHLRKALDAHVNVGNALCIAANRISYLLDLRGPSFAVESACSSSLTAVHLACRSLLAGESEMAIAGGVNLVLSPELSIGFCKASMISPDGRCRAFDARANGYVRSEGAGAVFLKTLDRALAESDPIYAVIRGTAVNEDGRTAGISLPSGESQEELIRMALRDAGLTADAVQYVEAHGTGTAAGDPAEAGALGRVFGAGRSPEDPCLIGSVKTNVGHLEAGAGITGLIKTALMLRHRQIPASLHFVEANPAIPLDELGLRVATRLQPWPETSGPGVAGVNAFGFGGSNAHVLLGEAPPAEVRLHNGVDRALLLTLSARSPEALPELAERYARHLRTAAATSAEDICYTASRRRSHYEHRMAVVGEDRTDLIDGLEAFTRREERANVLAGRAQHEGEPRLAFAFSGMGPQWWAMGRQLMAREPVYREALEECDRLLRPISGWSLLEELGRDENSSRIAAADLAHVGNLAVQIGLTALWRSWGIEPDAVVAHSSGEIAAACVCGALTLPDALHLAYHRGRLQHTLAGTGGMLAATISPPEVGSLLEGLEDRVSLAAVNSCSSVTLSGELRALEQIQAELDRREIFCRLLDVDVPYHAPQMAGIRDELLELLRGLAPADAKIPFISSVTGAPVAGPELDAAYWWENVRSPVRFAAALDRLIEDGYGTFLEVGPHPVLSFYIRECMASRETAATVLPTLRRNESEGAVMRRSLAALHVSGRTVDWGGVHREGQCTSLPTYPWQRERYWIETLPDPAAATPGIETGHPLLGRSLHSPRAEWESDLEDPRTDYLDQHVVHGGTVFPGAGYVEMMLAAAGQMWDGESVLLEHVEFRKLLFLDPPRSCLLQLQYRAADSTVEIHGASKADRSSWALHATGRMRRRSEPRDVTGIDLRAVLARCGEAMSVEEHVAALEACGFVYGAAFRGLRDIRFGPGEAIARIGFPPGAELTTETYRLHPALLDAAFQLLAVAGLRQRDQRSALPLFPVGIRKVTFHAPPGADFLAHVTVSGSGAELLEGDVVLLDDSGRPAVTIEGLRTKLLEDGQAGRRNNDDGWFYELGWEERPARPGTVEGARQLLPVREVREAVERGSPGPETDPAVRRYHEVVQPALDRIAAGFAARAVEGLGWSGREHDRLAADELAERLGVAPVHRRLLAELIRMAGRHWAEFRDGAGIATDALHALLDDLIREQPEYAAECELVRRGGDRLTDILRGRVDPREVLFSGDSRDLLSRMYNTSPACRTYHDVLGRMVSAAVGDGAAAAPLRILEVGAGTGAATAAVLPNLPGSAEYVFTDISPFFLAQARSRFAGETRLRYSVLDIEGDPLEQGYAAHSFDLVIADNVLHTTADLKTTLNHVSGLLRPGGVVAILELTRAWDWCNLVFGLLEGWWRFSDHDLRRSSALLQPAGWQSLLRECGFEEATSVFGGERDAEHLQGVLLARIPEAAAVVEEEAAAQRRSRSWLLMADRGGAAARLASTLRQRGDRCVLAYAGDGVRRLDRDLYEIPVTGNEGLAALLEESRGPDDRPATIVHLWSLDAPAGESVSTAELMDSQRVGCASLLGIFHQLGSTSAPTVWVVTAGAQAVDASAGVPRVSQSTLWGLGRVAASEHGAERCRLVDLSASPGDEEISSLARLMMDGEEDEQESEGEVALRGARVLVRRLQRVSRQDLPKRGRPGLLSPDAAAFGLEIGTPGDMEQLALRERPTPEPGPGEIAIRVRASGLNFREVLKVLGALPEPALRAAGDDTGLGVECAGVVISCGAGVVGFRPGDEVIALASGAHGSHVVARSHLVVAKPPGQSFAEAASLVNAFVTAHYALRHVARVEDGERVLIHSATGGVGLAAIQMCRKAGAEIFATAGTPEKRAYLTALGIEHVMDSRSLSFVDEVRARTGGEGVDVVLNSLAGEPMRASLELLRPYGRFVELGKRDIYENGQIDLLPFRRNLAYAAVDLMQLALDRPAFANRMIRDMVEAVAAGTWEPLPLTEFDLADAQSAFRFMAQARHTGKIVLTVAGSAYPVHPSADAPPYREDATYLITGGLGGFGLAAAEWLVARGVRSIVLMSRSAAPQGDATALDRLAESGARVVIVRGDVADEDDVARVLEMVRRDLPPLRGVLHAAMVLDDDLLERLDEERLFDVLAPKVAGAWNLHRLTAPDELDFFLLFSSVASVIGHPLQGNYAAANAFLDALASCRQSLGLPALTISWGALAGVGYVSRHPEVSEYLERSGFASFTTVEAFEAMEELLASGLPHVMAARLDWATWAARNPSVAASSRFSHVMLPAEPEGMAAAIGRPDSPLAGFRAQAPEQRLDAVREYLAQRIARVLGGDPMKVDLERPLIDLGFDSLMGVELVTALKSDLAVALPVVKILQGITGRELTSVLIEQMAFEVPSDGKPGKQGAIEPDAASAEPDAASAEPAVGSAEPAVGSAESVPLSFEQRRFWFLDRLSPANPAYNLCAAARLLGPLDERAVQQSVEEVVRRHDVLRASFESLDGEPLQVIVPATSLSLRVHDLRARPPAGREDALQRIAMAEIREPFDLARPPLLRAALVRLDEEEHVLLLVIHHIACDGWGITLLVREVMSLYGEFASGRAPSLPASSARYVRYARAQAEALTEAEAARQLEYWRKRLSGATPELSLPADHPRPATPSFRGGHVDFELPEDLTAALGELARREGVTLFALLVAAFQALLSRYSGQTDLSIGTAVATRDRPGTEDLLGCCMNTLVLRGDVSGDPSVRELLRRAKQTCLEALQNQDLPFERVVETLRPARDASHSPLFRAMIILHNMRWPVLRMGSLRIHPLRMESGSSTLDLTLLVDPGERLQGTLEYSTDLFERGTAVRMVEHLRALLREMAADPEQTLSSLAITDGDELRRVAEWNDTAHDFGNPRCVHELVSEQAVRTPDAPAIVASGERLTYLEVDERARLLAVHLKRHGVGPESVVATCLGPSVDLPVALLGILRAGGAFLVLDAAYPAARLINMLESARADVLIARGPLPADLAECGAAVVLLDEMGEEADPEASAPIDGGVTPDNLAYIAFTSGSSGEPNPVMVPHRALWNQISWRQLRFPMGSDDAVLMRTPIGFDPAIWEFFGPLAAGARLVIPPAGAADASAVLRCIGEHGVTMIQAVPSVLAALLDHPDVNRARLLRRIICGGEPLPRELQDSCFARLPGVQLHNLYGPTETTIDATWWHCRPGDLGASAPIGRPIANVRVYVLDERMRPAPIGVPGEIFIGGAGVARGYLDRAGLNAARFLRDPFPGSADSRLYRTGDRGRWRPDGNLEFLGRLDDQVKVRGHRVEPAEVEAAIRAHQGVAEAMVIGRSDAAGGNRLEAWAVGRPGRTPTTAELRVHLEARLPAHMVPAPIAFTDALPLLPSGKLDRRTPIADSTAVSGLPGGHRPPRDALELQLIGIWETFFDARPIGVTDDFFDLGGHSLLAMRLQARLRSDLGAELPVASLLQHRTVERLAHLLRGRSEPSATSHLVPIQPNGDRPPLFFVHPAGGGVLCYLDLARCLGAEQPFYGIEARGLTAGEVPHDRIEDMAADYVEAVLAARPEGPYRLGGWSLGGVVAFEMARQLQGVGREVELVALLDAWPAAPDANAAERSKPLEAFARSIGVPAERLSTAGRAFRDLSQGEQLAILLEHARAIDLVPSEADPEELRRRLHLFAAHLHAMQDYAPGPYPGEITLFRAAEAAAGGAAAPGGAWTALARGGVDVHSVPGTHHTMLHEEGVRIIAKHLTAGLAQVPAISG